MLIIEMILALKHSKRGHALVFIVPNDLAQRIKAYQ